MKKINYYLLSTVLLISLSTLALNFTSNSIHESSNLANDEIVSVDTENSVIKWKGEKVTGFHEGIINIKTANLTFDNKDLTGGEVIIDMSSIDCTDLSGPYKNKLEEHLNSSDFFNVTEYPISKLKITDCKKLSKNLYEVVADLTIKNITESVQFETELLNNVASADLIIDRTKFDIKYSSGSFFKNLGDKMIYDNFSISVNINY
ncbi:MAG: lipid-binding protein [Flavobacteriales bacterium]|nr:lipid-binding protein [Flavobacteriales bacterium]|tara:strand:- start:814 stop:1428 length:615 start_codon:yes stop_codon:yes gene_type:complete